MRRALKQSQETLRMLTVGQVASSLIQDFRAPMREILSAIDQIQRDPLDEEKKLHACDSARSAVQVVNKTTQDLLYYTTGDLKVEKKLTDVTQLMRTIASQVNDHHQRW
jgi:hypothetical protein